MKAIVGGVVVGLCMIAAMAQIEEVPALWNENAVVGACNSTGRAVWTWLDATLTVEQKCSFVETMFPEPAAGEKLTRLDRARRELLKIGADAAPIMEALDAAREAVEAAIVLEPEPEEP